MTNSQERLNQKLTKLFGGRTPIKHWSLPDVTDELLKATKEQNKSFLKLEGDFESRFVGDALVGAGFNIEVKDGESFTIVW
jgi:hypothetical protein